MSAISQLKILVDSVSALARLPVAELAENKKLIAEMTTVMNARGLGKLVDAIQAEHFAEKQEKFRAKPYRQDENFLGSFARFKSAAFNLIKQNAPTAHTTPLDLNTARAFNGKIESDKRVVEKVRTLPETKEFAEIFNSIYASGALEINTPQDPTRLRSFIDYSPYLYNYAYFLSIPTLAQMVKRPINLALKKFPKVEFEKHDVTEKMEKIFKREQIQDIIFDYLRFSALSPRGSLLVPIIQNGRVRFNVFNDTSFTYGSSGAAMSNIAAKYSKTRVGDIFCLGSVLTNEVTCLFNCPDFEPTYAIGSNKLFQLKEAAEALNIYIYTIKVLCIRAQVIIQKSDGEGQTDTMLENMKAQLSRLSKEMGLSTPLVQPEGNELDILNNNISPGFADVAPVLKDFVGILGGISPDYHFGSDSAYQANSFNIATTNENIHADIQKPQIIPALRFIANTYLAFDSRFKGLENLTDEFDIECESIYEETEKERADLDTVKIDNLIKMRDYPELEEAFKAEGVLDKTVTFAHIPPPGEVKDKGTGDGTPSGDVADTDEGQGLETRPPGNVPT